MVGSFMSAMMLCSVVNLRTRWEGEGHSNVSGSFWSVMATGFQRDEGDRRWDLVTWAVPSSVDDGTANCSFIYFFFVADFVLSALPALFCSLVLDLVSKHRFEDERVLAVELTLGHIQVAEPRFF